MKALITGASSGIGRDMARYLSGLGYDLVIVARRKELLEELKKDLKTEVKIECVDISEEENCIKLFEQNKDIDILINNAGFGDFGNFDKTDLNKEIVIIATTNLFSNFDKALIRRFDAVINFDRYSKEDLIEVAEYYFSSFVKNFKGISKDTRLFKKILNSCENLPYPGELKNVIKTSLAFSDMNYEHDYLRRLYNSLIGNLDGTDIAQLYSKGFTVREIEKLKGESKSTVARKLNKDDE